MFLIRFLRWLFGWVRLTAEGGFPERLLNLAAREEIQLWGICRQGITLTACCRAKDDKRLRQPARKACMRMRVRERHGAPFFLRRYHARAGIAVGLAAYILLLHFFSQRIWAIDVIGNEKLSDREILSVLEPMGVELGKISENLDIPNIQLIALQKIPDVAWLAVNLSGSVARVEVKERTLPPTPTDPNRPSNIRAARDGRIIEFSVYGGEAAVQNGDAVTEGMLLVSGVIEGEKGTILRRSQAKIIAETNRELEVRVPLKETRLLPTGRTIFRPTLNFFTLSIPWYTDGPIDSEYSLEESQHPLMAGGLPMPLSITSRRYILMEPAEIVRTEREAAALAEKQLAQKEQAELGNARITASQYQGETAGGYYVLRGAYQCIEDIGVEEQILLD